MADSRGRAYRKSHASGATEVLKWIEKWWGETKELVVQEIRMECPDPDALHALKNDETYRAAFRNRKDSDLHSFLKYVAWRWLDGTASVAMPCQGEFIRYEQRVYSPLDSALEKAGHIVDPLGYHFDPTMAQLLRRGDTSFIGDCGNIITVDVFGKGTNIEVGRTTPYNLLTPFNDILSNRTVWIPFPAKLQPKDFSITDFRFCSVIAYEISDK